MRPTAVHIPLVSNDTIAVELRQIALFRELAGVSPFRVAAYRNAAVNIRKQERPLAELYLHEGKRGLERLPGVGKTIARRIAEIIRHGRSRVLERLKARQNDGRLLATLPTVGARLAERLSDSLHSNSLEDVYAAASDGRLRRVAGFGRKRVDAVREALAARLKTPPAHAAAEASALSAADLLKLDRLYRHAATNGRLLLVAPRKFNPTRAAWLPVMKLEVRGVAYTIHYANTAQSQALGRHHDWVVIYTDDKQHAGRWTVVTAPAGELAGKRVVRGREAECVALHRTPTPRQMALPIE